MKWRRPDVLEKSRDIIPHPQMANFVFLAEGQTVVSPTGDIFSTPENYMHFPEKFHEEADTRFAAKWTPPHYSNVPLETRVGAEAVERVLVGGHGRIA